MVKIASSRFAAHEQPHNVGDTNCRSDRPVLSRSRADFAPGAIEIVLAAGHIPGDTRMR
jgi:hypothetical protein